MVDDLRDLAQEAAGLRDMAERAKRLAKTLIQDDDKGLLLDYAKTLDEQAAALKQASACALNAETKMRCFLMRNGHIAAVQFVTVGPDESLIEQAKEHFGSRVGECFDGFEVWDGTRRVFGHPNVLQELEERAG